MAARDTHRGLVREQATVMYTGSASKGEHGYMLNPLGSVLKSTDLWLALVCLVMGGSIPAQPTIL